MASRSSPYIIHVVFFCCSTTSLSPHHSDGVSSVMPCTVTTMLCVRTSLCFSRLPRCPWWRRLLLWIVLFRNLINNTFSWACYRPLVAHKKADKTRDAYTSVVGFLHDSAVSCYPWVSLCHSLSKYRVRSLFLCAFSDVCQNSQLHLTLIDWHNARLQYNGRRGHAVGDTL